MRDKRSAGNPDPDPDRGQGEGGGVSPMRFGVGHSDLVLKIFLKCWDPITPGAPHRPVAPKLKVNYSVQFCLTSVFEPPLNIRGIMGIIY